MNKKKLFKICGLIAILLVGGVFSACSSAGAISTYTIPLTEMPKNLDAQVATSPQEILVLTNIYDGLYDFVGGEAVPNLAKSCAVSQDGLEYTFILKETSSFYAKGVPAVPVKAKDFIFSFTRIQDPNTHSPYYDEFKNIVEMEAPDDYTLKIKLARRDGNFLDKLCIPAASPCNEEFFKSTQGAYGLGVKNIMSNGPFAVNYLADDDSYATLVRVVDNKNAIARIRLSLNDGEETLEKMFKEDRISGFFAQGKLSENLECKKESFMGTNVNLIFNMEKPEYKNENIRKALAYYAFGMENSGANLAAVKQSYSAFTDTLSFANKGINEQITLKKPDYLGQNPKNICQEGLGELGQTKLTGTKVLLPSDSPYTVIFENINQLWQKELGQFFSLELLPQSEITKRIAAGNFDIAFSDYTPQINSPFVVLDGYTPYDADIDFYTKEAYKNAGSPEMLVDIEQSHNLLLNRAYIVPMCKNESNYCYKKYFENVVINPFGNIINLKYATVK